MKRFLVKTSLLAAIVVSVLVCGLYFKYVWAAQTSKVRFMLEPAHRIVVVGDSHAECSFVETNGIKMLTYHSTPLNVSLMRLYELEKSGKIGQVRVIVANLCYTTCSEWSIQGQIESTWRFLPNSLSYTDLIPIPKTKLFLELLIYSFRHMNQTPPIVTNPQARGDEPSIDEREAEWTIDSTEQAIERHFEWKKLANSRVDKAEDSFALTIERLKAFCDRHEIELVMFSAPLSQGYIDRVPQWGRENLSRWVAFVKKHGIAYYDYMNSCPSSCFRDGDHLSKQGAKFFTEQFYNEVLSRMLE